MSVSSSDSQLSALAEQDMESEASDLELDAKFFNVEDCATIRFRKKDRTLLYVFQKYIFIIFNFDIF